MIIKTTSFNFLALAGALFAAGTLQASLPWVYNKPPTTFPAHYQGGQPSDINANAFIPAITQGELYRMQPTSGVLLPSGSPQINTFTVTKRSNVLVLGLGQSAGGVWSLGYPTLTLKKLVAGNWVTLKTNSNWTAAHPQAGGPVLIENILSRVSQTIGGRTSADAAIYMQLDAGSYRAELQAAGGDGVLYVEFLEPSAVSLASDSSVDVADRDTIWRILNNTPTVLAGNGNEFIQITAMISDGAGGFYVADAGRSVIFRVSGAGVVTTVAGTSGSTGFRDGTGAAARFNEPQGLALDGSGNLFVADSSNMAIRKIDSAGVVTTLTLVEGSDNNPPVVPPPAPPASGGGGGGGAPSYYFIAALAVIGAFRAFLANGKQKEVLS